MTAKTRKKSKINSGSLQKDSKKKLSKLELLELKALDKWRERNEVGPLKFEGIGGSEIDLKEKDLSKLYSQMMETTGSPDIYFSSTIISQATSTLSTRDKEERMNFVTAFIHGLKPRDELEAVLITQMVGTHNLIMEYMGRAMIPDQTTEGVNDNTNRAYKLMNIFLKQIEALNKYRGKMVQQKMTVEHVHVHKGGKAIVGHVESRQKGGGGG
ncbi:MAG: hypothetical protein ACE5K3_02700 [bacterium]